MQKIRIGTRGSKLALWQAEFVSKELERHGLKTEIAIIETKGDQIQDVSISKIGGKGIFTQELEDKLRTRQIDIAVHSAKDLQSNLGEEFRIIAFTEREKANDVLVSSKNDVSLQEKIVVGTSSTRRIATLKYHFPHVTTVEMRGNLQTRLKKMEDGVCDALILAYAGIHRMGYDDLIAENLSLEIFTPAVGQGCLAVESHIALDQEIVKSIRAALNDEETETLVNAERAYLRILEGGCSIPAFALAQTGNSDSISLRVGLYSLDGRQLITKYGEGHTSENEELGKNLAISLLDDGGATLLKEIKMQLNRI